MLFFTVLGLTIGISILIALFTFVTGWVSGEDDFCMRWIMTCILYGMTLACLITGVFSLG